MRKSIWIGFDPREAAAFAVAVHSIRSRLSADIEINGVVLDDLRRCNLYYRPTEKITNSDGHPQLIDLLSKRHDYNGAMATEFAISRFLVPHLAETGWALFMDCDMMIRTDINELFDLCDPDKAVMCVKHNQHAMQSVKMDGQVQTNYSRKNWSSVMAFNCDHLANQWLTVDLVNTAPGRDLHRFCWLGDAAIGELPMTWNWLAGESAAIDNPKVVHHTLGSPFMTGYESAPFADEWRAELADWAVRP